MGLQDNNTARLRENLKKKGVVYCPACVRNRDMEIALEKMGYACNGDFIPNTDTAGVGAYRPRD